MNKLKIIFLSLCMLALFSYCNTKQEKKTSEEKNQDSLRTKTESTTETNPESSGIAIDTLQTDISAYISGMPALGKSVLNKQRDFPRWKNFAAMSDTSWKSAELKRLNLMKKWADTELPEAKKSERAIFYPFGGPDFLNVFTLFPNSDSYTLVGLEPVGEIPDIKSMNEKNIDSYLNSVENSLSDIFRKSYFISKNMLVDLQSNRVNGTQPLLEIFLARTNNKIIKIEDITIDDQGKPVPYTKPDVPKINKGIKIEFVSAGSNKRKYLYYFKVDLSDKALATNPAFIKLATNLGTVTTYLKSASYLLHYKTFNTIRELILNQSAYLLQDDSGIAYRFFDQKKWKCNFYGRYTRPVDDFKGVEQEDLKEIYTKNQTTIKPLPFVLGYHWKSLGINLMTATKIAK